MAEQHILITQFDGNPNIGLYGLVTDKHILLGHEVPTKHDTEFKKVLGLPIKRINIAGTGLVGVFCCFGNGKLLVPHIIFKDELEELESLGYDIEIIETDLTCLGNNILFNEKAGLINPDFTKRSQDQIARALNIPIEKSTIMEIEALGAIGIILGEKGLFHRDIPHRDIMQLEKKFSITITQGTVNMGNPYIKSGIVCSKKGFAVGNSSGGPEIRNVDEALGFIE